MVKHRCSPLTFTSAHPNSPPRFRKRSTDSKSHVLIPNRIFLGGLSLSVFESDIEAFFAEFGAVNDVKIIRKEGMDRAYGFVTFVNQEDANKALELSGNTISIKGTSAKVGPALKKMNTEEKPESPNQISPPICFPSGKCLPTTFPQCSGYSNNAYRFPYPNEMYSPLTPPHTPPFYIVGPRSSQENVFAYPPFMQFIPSDPASQHRCVAVQLVPQMLPPPPEYPPEATSPSWMPPQSFQFTIDPFSSPETSPLK